MDVIKAIYSDLRRGFPVHIEDLDAFTVNFLNSEFSGEYDVEITSLGVGKSSVHIRTKDLGERVKKTLMGGHPYA